MDLVSLRCTSLSFSFSLSLSLSLMASCDVCSILTRLCRNSSINRSAFRLASPPSPLPPPPLFLLRVNSLIPPVPLPIPPTSTSTSPFI